MTTSRPRSLAGLPEEAQSRLRLYVDLLQRWGRRTNLVGPQVLARPWDDIEEALTAAQVVPPPASLLDIGSGAGLPAIPLAIAWPGCRVTMCEPRERRRAFLDHCRRELGLEADSTGQRWQEIAGAGGRWQALSARGVGEVETWLLRLAGNLEAPGLALLYTGDDVVKGVAGTAGFRRRTLVDAASGGRKLLVLERVFPVEHPQES